MNVSIIVATYGSRLAWDLLAARAVASAVKQTVPCELVRYHGVSLHEARNTGLARATGEWVVHLDADDELEPRYVEKLLAGSADVRAPGVAYIRGNFPMPARLPRVAGHTHQCTADCLSAGNWLIVGAMARRELLLRVGGWRNFQWSEDWDLWVRCWQAGASIAAHPEAVYRAHVRPGSRNKAAQSVRLAQHRAIARANGLPVP